MNFTEAESYLYSLGNEVSAMKLGLDNIRKLLNALGDPQNNYLKVQVAGTNGKGSVCAFLDSICNEAGISTGTFTSPHLVSITERIRINGDDISEKSFARYASRVRETAETLVKNKTTDHIPTFFEQVTAIALFAFAEAKVEVAILETGLGGRLDATTAANAEIAAITRIDLDHQEYLGDTIEEIAAEKAAIIAEHTLDAVLGEQSRSVMALLRKRCKGFGIKPINDQYESWRVLPAGEDQVKVELSLIMWPPIQLGLAGKHQRENAQTAIQVMLGLRYNGLSMEWGEDGEFHIIEGLKKARHTGRLEYVGNFLLDGAHNVAGAKALHNFLDESERRPITLIFGAMDDKNVSEMMATLFPKAADVILTQSSNSRAMSANDLLNHVPKDFDTNRIEITATVEDAIERAQDIALDGEVVLVAGSLYLVGEVKKILRSQI